MKVADLHLHTFFSDGTYSPEELITEADKNGLSAISVVDHDTVEGVEAVIEAGKSKNLEVLPGIELTAEFNGTEIHVLGYLIDYKNDEFRQDLQRLKENRVERVYKITDKLSAMGKRLNPQTVFNLAGQGTVGRLHIARAMEQEGLVSSIFEAFHKYIGDRCPAYVCGFRFSPYEAIKLIKKVGGIPVLAHPYIINRDEWIIEFIKYGMMGLEVYYTEHTSAMINAYLGLAQKYNLLVTGGSDCHGKAKPEAKIGSIKIPYELVNNLKQAKEKNENP